MTEPVRVGLVTCRELPEPDPDQNLLLAALHGAGVDVELVAWDGSTAHGISSFDSCVLRSCWNYHELPGEFRQWIDSAGRLTRLWNPEPIVTWNLHKRYLRYLAAAGIPTVPTAWFRKGNDAPLRETVESNDWSDIVVKPAISASSYRTHRFRLGDGQFNEAQAALDDLLRDRDAMVQPYVPGVETLGERAVMWIDSEITHAIRKSSRFAGDVEAVSQAVTASEAEREVALRSVAVAAAETGVRPLYARVDLMPDAQGDPMVSELELIEPSLYLRQSPAALDRFVRAIATTPAS
jgi:hypothetical protein